MNTESWVKSARLRSNLAQDVAANQYPQLSAKPCIQNHLTHTLSLSSHSTFMLTHTPRSAGFFSCNFFFFCVCRNPSSLLVRVNHLLRINTPAFEIWKKRVEPVASSEWETAGGSGENTLGGIIKVTKSTREDFLKITPHFLLRKS